MRLDVAKLMDMTRSFLSIDWCPNCLCWYADGGPKMMFAHLFIQWFKQVVQDYYRAGLVKLTADTDTKVFQIHIDTGAWENPIKEMYGIKKSYWKFLRKIFEKELGIEPEDYSKFELEIRTLCSSLDFTWKTRLKN